MALFKKPSEVPFLPKINPVDYLTILFNDLNYDRLQRNDKLSEMFGRKISFLDELKPIEIRKAIGILRMQKYGHE